MSSTVGRLSRRISAVVLLGGLAACAGMDGAQCRDANWYEVGYRDARYKTQSRVDQYAEQCGRQGVQIDAARYQEGHRQGRWDFPDRMT